MVKTPAARGETPMTNDALIEENNSAYRLLSAAAEELVRADRELAEYVRGSAWTMPRPSWRLRTRGQRASTSTACLTPTSTAAWRTSGRGRSSSTSTPGVRWTGCT
jgi:hypothetical protein